MGKDTRKEDSDNKRTHYNAFLVPRLSAAISIVFLAILSGVCRYMGIKNDFEKKKRELEREQNKENERKLRITDITVAAPSQQEAPATTTTMRKKRRSFQMTAPHTPIKIETVQTKPKENLRNTLSLRHTGTSLEKINPIDE